MLKRRMLARGLAVSIVLGTVTPKIKVYAQSDNIEEGVSVNNVYVDKFIEEGVIVGYGEEGLLLEDKVTRAEFVKIVNKAFKLSEIKSKECKEFKDLNKTAWYYEDIKIGVSNGYIEGYEDGTFRPNEEITREEMSKILGVLLKVEGKEGGTKFKDDVEIGEWSKKYIIGLVEKGILQGYPNGEFNPKAGASREESIIAIGGAREVKWKEEGQGLGAIKPHGGDKEEDKEEIKPPEEEKEEIKPPEEEKEEIKPPEEEKEEEKEEINPPEEDKEEDKEEINPPQIESEGGLLQKLEDPKVSEVEFVGTELQQGLEIPKGKKVTLLNEVTVTSDVIVQGELVIDGNLVIEEGGSLIVGSDFNVTRGVTNEETSIKGQGVIEVKDGTLKADSKGSIEANIKASKDSNVEIGEDVLLDKEGQGNLSLNTSESTIEIKRNPTDIDIDKIVIEGGLEVKEDIEGYTLKAKNEESLVMIKDKKQEEGTRVPVQINIEGVEDVKYGYYRGLANGRFIKEANTNNISKSVTKTEEDSLITGESIDLEQGLEIEPNVSVSEIETEVTNDKDVVQESNIDVDESENINIKVSIPSNKKVVGIKINEKLIKLESVVEGGKAIKLSITREDFNKLGLDKYRSGLTVEVIAKDEGYPITHVATKKQTPPTNITRTGHQGLEASNTINKGLQETYVEVFFKGKKVKAIDYKKVMASNSDTLDFVIHLAEKEQLTQLVFNEGDGHRAVRVEVPEATASTRGKTITVKFQKGYVYELENYLEKIDLTVYVK